MKICFTASSGGHLEEITCLRDLCQDRDSFLITEECGELKTAWNDDVYFVPQINRKEKGFLLHFIKLFFKANRIIKKEKPDYIISTGALATYPVCVIGKLRKVKVIYIESFARVDEASLTGKLMYPIADLFLVQWEEMLEIFPKATYGGGIF